MRIKHARALASALMIFGASLSFAPTAPADDTALNGSWKLVVLPYGEDEFAIIKLTEKDGKATGSVVDAQQMLRHPAVATVEPKDGSLSITMNGSGVNTSFKGKIATSGPAAGKFLGMVTFGGGKYPARLEPTKESKVGPLKQPSPTATKLRDLLRERDPKAKFKAIEEAIRGTHGSPYSATLYSELLRSAEQAGLGVDKAKEIVQRWIDEAKPYGDEWSTDIRLRALRAVASNKSLAKLTVDLAQENENAVGENDHETKAIVLAILARAARDAGMETLANDTETRHVKLERLLDEEYHHKVPPFKPTPYAGRKDKTADQTVLMELFTGAQCPPCVAADVAFDALLAAYKPAEFIGLQYHLHIPGPDPLTNDDSVARQKFYEVRSTPSTFFNGHSEAGGGGGMDNSEAKYAEYHTIIDKSLENPRRARISLTATRAGDQIKIAARAEVTDKAAHANGSSKSDAKGEPNSNASGEQGKPVLHLALTEEEIRYVGGNKLRFHHHVVRALPGGAKGVEIKQGKGKADVTVNISDLKRDLEKYLSDYTKTRPFPNPLPEIKLDKLAVVAFVQDDGNKSVLNAVSVPVVTVNP